MSTSLGPKRGFTGEFPMHRTGILTAILTWTSRQDPTGFLTGAFRVDVSELLVGDLTRKMTWDLTRVARGHPVGTLTGDR